MDNAIYEKALNKWDSYLINISRSMCSRRGIASRCDEDDFYQIALMGLLDALNSYEGSYEEPEFGHHLATVLRHDCLDEISFQTAGIRDYRKKTNASTLGAKNEDKGNTFFDFHTIQRCSSEDQAEIIDTVKQARNLLGKEKINTSTGKPIPGSGTDEFYLFNEYVYTALYGPHADIEKVYQEHQDEKLWYLECPKCGYKRVLNHSLQKKCEEVCPGNIENECGESLVVKGGRVHERIPLVVYAKGFGWKRSYARKVMSNIRATLINTLGLNPDIFSPSA